MHRFTPYFPSGHRPEINIFFLPFHPFRACPDVLTLSSYAVPGSESFARTLSGAIAGLLRVFTAEMPGLQHCQLHIQTGSPSNPDQWSIACQSQWWMPAPLAVAILDPGAWFPSMSWQRLAWSSAHLQTGSNVAHSQLARTRSGERHRTGRSLCHFSHVAAPQLPLTCPPLP